jgi:hypothetical protein
METLTVSLGTFERHGWTSAAKARRTVYIQNCVVVRGNETKKLKYEQIDISAYQRGDEPWRDERIGGFNFNRGHINLSLPTETFDQVWEAAAATDGVRRHMIVTYQASEGSVVGVSEATLVEFMSGDMDTPFDPKTGRALRVPPRKDPILAALQSVRTEITWLFRFSWLLAALIAIEAIRR